MVSPEDYVETAVVAHEAGEEMLSRLDFMTIKPAVILDIGCGAGVLGKHLADRYPSASIFSIDVDKSMLQYTLHQGAGSVICADTNALPFADNSVDFVFANFILPWCHDFQKVLLEWKRVLRPEGLLMLTALGPETLQACHGFIIPGLIDMHDLGDVLLQMGWSDPVLDVCQYTTTYRGKEKLKKEVCASGMVRAEMDVSSIPFELNYEVIHAHAFKAMPKEKPDNVVKVPVSRIVRKNKD